MKFLRNNPIEPITDTTQLLHMIGRKDAVFRVTQSVFLIGILAALGVLLYSNYHLQVENRQLLTNQAQVIQSDDNLTKQLQASVNDLRESNASQLTDLQHHIDCIVSLFTQPNRTSLIITDIESCKLTSTSSNSSTTTKSTKGNVTTSLPTTSTNNQQISNNQSTSPQPSPAPSPTPTPSPKPTNAIAKVVCTVTLGLVCL